MMQQTHVKHRGLKQSLYQNIQEAENVEDIPDQVEELEKVDVEVQFQEEKESINEESKSDLLCEIYFVIIEANPYDPNSSESTEYRCFTNGGVEGAPQLVYKIEGFSNNLRKTDHSRINVRGGNVEMLIKHGVQYKDDQEYTILLPPDADINISQSKHKKSNDEINNTKFQSRGRGRGRALIPTTPNPFIGIKTALVIRVSADNGSEQPTANAAVISRRVFGGFDDEFNLKSGYVGCSANQLIIEKAEGPKIVNGVLEISLSESLKGRGGIAMENDIFTASKTELGLSDDLEELYDFIMLCLPPGTGVETAYAYVGLGRSMYNDEWCLSPSTQMHEIGHSIGLYHSNQNGIGYQDESCLMGFSSIGHEDRRMCFNGAKSWILGWYYEKSVSKILDSRLGQRWNGNLVGVANYEEALTSRDEYVLFELVTDFYPNDNIQNLYLLYNKREGINNGVIEFGDKVTITRGYFRLENNILSEDRESDHVASLLEGEAFTVNDHFGIDLIIKFCSTTPAQSGRPPSAQISLFFVIDPDPCESVTVKPTPPTNPPSPSPKSGSPSKPPTLAPNIFSNPSNLPSIVPSKVASKSPTIIPSYLPSKEPSKLPSSTPTLLPSAQPSLSYLPSLEPSTKPTSIPTKTTYPTLTPSMAPSTFCPFGQFRFVFQLTTDHYPGETSWILSNDTIIDQSETSLLRSKKYEHDYCLEDGCYDIIIKDAHGDGNCCSDGEGGYKGFLHFAADSPPDFEGGDFYFSAEHRLCGGEITSTPSSAPSSACPTDEFQLELFLVTDKYPEETSFRLMNISDDNSTVIQMENSFSRSTSYVFHNCYPKGCYAFEILDESNDGICCGFGEGSFEILINGIHKIEGGDFKASQYENFCGCPVGERSFALDLVPDEYPAETSWEVKNSFNSVVLNGTFSGDTACVPEDCYTFYIYDSIGDGICCAFGSGSFVVSYDNVEVGQGAVFNDTLAVKFGDSCLAQSASEPRIFVLDQNYDKHGEMTKMELSLDNP